MAKKIVPATLAALAFATFGFTASEAAINQTVVSYADLDISRVAGAQVLLGRIKTAADRVCGSRPFTLELKEQQAYMACTEESTENAVVDVDAPMLSALYDRGGGSIGVVTVYEGGYPEGPVPGNVTMEPIPNP